MRIEDLSIQSHIYINSNSWVSSDFSEICQKIDFFKSRISVDKSDIKQYFYLDSEALNTNIFQNYSLAHLPKEIPQNMRLFITEIFLRGRHPEFSLICPGNTKSNTEAFFFCNCLDHCMAIADIEKKISECSFPGFYLYLIKCDSKKNSILDIENIDSKINIYNREYVSNYLKRCSEVCKKIEKNVKLAYFRYDSKDESELPHIHYKTHTSKEEATLNLIDKYFNNVHYQKHNDSKNLTIPKSMRKFLEADFKLP